VQTRLNRYEKDYKEDKIMIRTLYEYIYRNHDNYEWLKERHWLIEKLKEMDNDPNSQYFMGGGSKKSNRNKHKRRLKIPNSLRIGIKGE
jgi:hypothetical protein